MQLKPYQQDVLADLAAYVEQLAGGGSLATSFVRYWQQHDPPLTPEAGQAVTPYHEAAVPDVPHVCVKVPTGGGKTLLACHALGTLLGQVPLGRPRLAVWLVPSLTILDQTIDALRNPRHPYGQALRTLFGGRVEVIDKAGLAQGQGLLDAASGEQLTVAVLSFDSLRATNKENRKNYQQNSAHQALVSALGSEGPAPLPDTDETATINALRKLEPVVIVDEAHNATTALSTEMLRNLAPAFVLEFTATPPPLANIISFVSAQALKDEQMVKLPVVVYNHHDKEDVINNALRLRQRLETLAVAAQRKSGAPVVRPIVLFQAQPRNAAEAADPTTYRKLKEQLRGLGIPDEQIKIKTGDLDELGRTDLLAADCPVRYIITVNALKEGWDCSFAYILASLANRSSPVEVEQLVGRVLRQPRATRHPVALLNMSYVLTASAQFDRTLKHIVAGLNQAGFSQDDFRSEEAPDANEPEASPAAGSQTTLVLESPTPALTNPDALDTARLRPAPTLPTEAAIAAAEDELTPTGGLLPGTAPATAHAGPEADETEAATAAIEAAALAAAATAAASTHAATTEATKQVKTYPMRRDVASLGQHLRLPYFVRPAQGMYLVPELLERGDLLGSFDLAQQRTNLNFENLPQDMWQIDVERQEGGYAPRLQKANDRLRQELLAVFENTSPAGQHRAVVKELGGLLSKRQNTVSDGKLKAYLERVFATAGPDRLREAKERPDAHAQVIRRFIGEVQTAHALEEFNAQLTSGELVAGLPYTLPTRRTVKSPATPLAQSLYEREEDGNSLEAEMMALLASASNIAFWTRNPVQKDGFRINGPVVNHYPDFIAQTQRGRVLLIETKGDDRDNSDSAAKISLGHAWETAASRAWEGSSAVGYHYFMVFKTAGLSGAFSLAKFMEQLARL